MTEFHDIHRLTSGVAGWLSPAEGELLYRLARACPAGSVIVEIGSYQGKSTIWLGKGSAAGNRCPVYAIDPHTGGAPEERRGPEVWTFDTFNANIRAARLEDLVKPIRAMSHEAIGSFDPPIGLIFIDGMHRYSAVVRDCREWLPRLIEGGVAALHDTMASVAAAGATRFLPGWDGPRRAFGEEVLNSRAYSAFGHAGTISYATRRRVGEGEWKRERRAYLRSTRLQRATTSAVTTLRSIGPLSATIQWMKRHLGASV